MGEKKPQGRTGFRRIYLFSFGEKKQGWNQSFEGRQYSIRFKRRAFLIYLRKEYHELKIEAMAHETEAVNTYF